MIDYRKFTGSRIFRERILYFFSWIPDKLMVRLQFFLQTGKFLNLNNPKSLNEKIQAYKLFYRNSDMLRATDKVELRNYITEKGFANILVPILGVYENVDEIDFEALPVKFVIKTSDGGGGNEVYICEDKDKENIEKLKNKLRQWMMAPKAKKHIGREWAYENGYPRKLIIEPLLEEKGKKDIDDYKFYCFQGKYKLLQWHKDRRSSYHSAGHYDENGKFLPEVFIYYPTFKKEEALPSNFKEMVNIAENLAKDFPLVRVDLYNVDGKIYLSELTFYPASGYYKYEPEYVDRWLGSFLKYPFETGK